MGWDDEVSDYFSEFDSRLLPEMISLGRKRFPTRDLKKAYYYMQLLSLYATHFGLYPKSPMTAADIKRSKQTAKDMVKERWEDEDEPAPPPPRRRRRTRKAKA